MFFLNAKKEKEFIVYKQRNFKLYLGSLYIPVRPFKALLASTRKVLQAFKKFKKCFPDNFHFVQNRFSTELDIDLNCLLSQWVLSMSYFSRFSPPPSNLFVLLLKCLVFLDFFLLFIIFLPFILCHETSISKIMRIFFSWEIVHTKANINCKRFFNGLAVVALYV